MIKEGKVKKTIVTDELGSKEVKNVKVISLLRAGVDNEAKAQDYLQRIKSPVYRTLIDPIVEEIEILKNKVSDLEDMSLETDKNRGIAGLSVTAIKNRVIEILELKESIFLQNQRLKVLKKYYKEYVGDTPKL